VPTLRTLLALAWPIVISRSAQVVVGIADATMVSHLGPAALAATTTGAVNAMALFILPMGTVFVVASFSSQLFGAGDVEGARRYGWYGLAVAAATQVLGVLSIGLLGPVLGRFAYAPDVQALLVDYVALRLWSGGAVVGLEALANYYGGLGNTRLPMLAQVAAMVLNVAGNWLLIDGHLGLPAMGVRGAALASALSTSLAFLGLLAVFVAAGGRRAGAGRLRLAELGRLLRVGIPSGLNWFSEFLAFLFFVDVVVAGLGTSAVAAFMSVIQLSSVAFMPSFALASAGAILVGQAIGAGRKDQVPRLVGLTFLSAGGWQALAGLVYLAIPALLLAPFARDPASAGPLLEMAIRMLRLSVAWALFDAAAATLAEALRAAGDTVWALWARVVIAWAIFAPGSWLTVPRAAERGDLVAVGWLVLYLGLLAGVLYLRFRSGAWRRIVLFEEGREAA
jgi:multidrug resistance protein, MATE family